MTPRPKNRLADATSPYLLSHAANPVDWYPWGDEALSRARSEDKPIFLSVGYAACHWCHVMERETFEDEEVATALRESFVSIKVDREERPDVDQLYMAATMAMTGGGGWPMTVFMTPSGRPFFAGTYFPKTTKFGRPGFLDLVRRIGELWRQKREDVEKQAETLVLAIADEAAGSAPAAIPASLEDAAVRSLLASFDPEWGGFGGAPKFPAPFTLELLLSRAARDERAREAVVTTLDRMARGGIYDHVAGGFARYSTDVTWHVPHFEKMLYDNAQLTRVYARAAIALNEPRFAEVARETARYLRREMQAPSTPGKEGGGFYSATDADSEGVEGKFFVWSLAEWQETLGDDAAVLAELFDVTESGNWEGHNVLRMKKTPDPSLDALVARAKEKLRARRALRVAPLTDDKILTGWNGLAISAQATVGFLLEDPEALAAAEASARFVLGHLSTPDGGLFRAHRDGRSHIPGFLEDYAFFCEGLVDLYEATGRYEWLRESLRLAERAAVDFASEQGFFFNTSKDHDALVLRMHEGTDGATASPNAVFARVLVRLATHYARPDLAERARGALLAFGRQVARVPRAFLSTLDVARRLREPRVEIALVAAPGAAAPLLRVLRRNFMQVGALAYGAETGEDPPHPLLAGRPRPAAGALAYVCREQACDAPTADPDELERALSRPTSRRAEVAPTKLPGAATPVGTRAFVEGGSELAGLSLANPAIVVGGFLEQDVHQTIETALEKRLQTFLFDLPRAEPTGAAVRKAVASGVPREAIVTVALLANHDVEAARELCERLGVHVDLVLVPTEAASSGASWEAASALREALPGTRVGVWLKAPLTVDGAAQIARGASGAVLVAAPYNVVEGDAAAPSVLADAGLPFVALRALECRFPPHVANLLDRTPPIADAPPFDDALLSLEALEDEYRRRIAVRLSSNADADPKRLLTFAEDLRRAEDALDDVAEVEAFVHEQLGRNVAAAWEALSGIGGELGEQIQELRERYLGALDLGLRALAQRVLVRQATFAESVADSLQVGRAELPERALDRVLSTPGVALAAVTVRKAEDLGAIARR
jgi:uncharacterized protein YyaL (SSP411 family)